jgi:hypothetical protein
MKTFTIPADIAEHLTQIESAMRGTVTRLEYLHFLWGDGEEDNQFPDGTPDEWCVQIEHSEVERLIESLRNVGEFAGYLAKFEQGKREDIPAKGQVQ